MALRIEDRVIEKVQIVDDEPSAREAYSFSVEDLDLIPVPADRPQYTNIDEFVDMIRAQAQASICDYHLSASNYATFNGGKIVAKLYQRQFPAILCTRYYDSEIDSIRPYKQYIPVLLNPDSLGPETIEDGFRRCVAEFKGRVLPSRELWRSLLRVDNMDEEKGYFYVVVPGWNPKKTIRLRLEDLPENVSFLIKKGQDRLHAEVNIGAENYRDPLLCVRWEQE